MRLARLLIAPLVLSLPGAAQNVDQGELGDLRAAHTAMSEQMARTENGLPLAAAAKIRLLREFLEQCGSHPDHVLVLQSRSRLGDLYLLLRDPRSLDEFSAILDHAGPTQRDLRGRARYGQAQAWLQRGRDETARELLETLARDEAGTRYGRMSRLALEHLDRGERALPGLPLPTLDFGRDLDGNLHSTTSLGGAPALLVFWSPDSPASVSLLERLAGIWERSGSDPERLLALALGGARGSVRALAERRGWSFPLVSCEAEFLEPCVLALSVEGVPSTLLLGADTTLLARDLSPDRLAELLLRGHGRD